MSKISLTPNASGTGTFTIASPNGNTDRTINLPDASGTVQVSGNPISGTTGTFSGNVTLGSSVLATPTGSAPSYTCRAWVNFNGTGTVAIRASGNVSSITDNGVGDYTVNFTTALPDANYSAVVTSCHNGTNSPTSLYLKSSADVLAGSVKLVSLNGSSFVAADNPVYCVAIFR